MGGGKRTFWGEGALAKQNSITLWVRNELSGSDTETSTLRSHAKKGQKYRDIAPHALTHPLSGTRGPPTQTHKDSLAKQNGTKGNVIFGIFLVQETSEVEVFFSAISTNVRQRNTQQERDGGGGGSS